MPKKLFQQSLKSYLNKGLNMKYLDLVELIKEKPAYIKAGVKVGDFGAIMSENPNQSMESGKLYFLNFIQEKILRILWLMKKI